GPLIARPGRSGPGVQLAPRARGGPPGPVTASGRRGPGPGHGERRMGRHLAIVVLVAVLGGADPAQARQRAVVGLGAGGGVILGTRLLEANGPDGASPGEIREVNLEDTPVASAHAEWYVIPHLALRGHIARGTGRLDVQSREPVVGSGGVSTSSEAGRVRITAYDVGLSVWPWAPNSVGFAPFVTVGFGRLIYDFADVDGGSPFEALGSR